MVFLISRLNTSEGDDPTAAQTEAWETGSPEGDINGIVTHEYTETLPPDLEPGLDEMLNSDTVTEETTVSEFDIETEIESESEQTSQSESSDNEPVYFWLDNGGKRLSTAVKWTQLNPEKKSDNSVSYFAAGCNVTLTLANGGRESYRDSILNKAESIGASVNEEIISYSPSRVTDMLEYDKYTLSYFENEAQEAPVYAYYLVSDVDDNLVYLVTISSKEPIDNDSEIFGILEYAVTDVE